MKNGGDNSSVGGRNRHLGNSNEGGKGRPLKLNSPTTGAPGEQVAERPSRSRGTSRLLNEIGGRSELFRDSNLVRGDGQAGTGGRVMSGKVST